MASAIGVVVSNLDTLAVVLTSRLAIGAAISAFGALTVAITSTAGAAAFAEGAFALLGGPVGILAIAAGLMYQFSTTTDIATQATDHLRAAIKKADDATNESIPGQKAALSAAIERANADLKAADAALTRAEAEQKLANANLPAPGATFTNGGGAFTLAAGMADSKVDSLKQHIADLRKEIFSANESLSILAIN